MSVVLNVSDDRQAYRSQAAALNAELSMAVQDSLHVQQPMLEEAIQEFQNWKKRWASWCDANTELTVKFDATYTHPEPVGYTSHTLDSEVGVALDTTWIQQYGNIPQQRLESVADVLDELYRGVIHPQKRNNAIAQLRAFTSKAFPLGDGQSVDGVLEVHDLQHSDPLALLRAEYTRSLHAISVLEAQLVQMLEERENCVRGEDVKGAEERSIESIECMKQIMSVAYGRHRDAVAAEVDVGQFQENVSTTKRVVFERLNEVQLQNTQFKQSATNDVQLLDAFVDAFEADAAQKSDQYQQRTSKFRGAMQDNTKQQIATWETVIQCLQQLSTLAQSREDLVANHSTDTVQERLRQQHQQELTAAANARKEELQRIVQNTTSAIEYCANVHQYIDQADEYINRMQFPTKLTKIQVEEGLRCYDIYKRYTLTTNSVYFRREQRLENVRRLLRSTEFQIANAIDTFDTDLPQYRTQLATLNATEVALSTTAQALADDMAEEGHRWFPLEAFLEEKRVDFDPPSLLVQELKRDLMVSRVEAVDELTNKEQKLLDSEKANVRKMLNAVEAAKEAFRDRRGVQSPSRQQ